VVARPSRLDIEGGWYHVLNRGLEKRRICPDEKANQHFSRIAWHPTGPFWASNSFLHIARNFAGEPLTEAEFFGYFEGKRPFQRWNQTANGREKRDGEMLASLS
jgi:hypothetical protein